MLKEYPNILKKEEKEFIKNNFLQNDAFSWYLNHIDVDKDYEFNNIKKNYWPFFSHSILIRPKTLNDESIINSNYYNYFSELFDKLSKRCNFTYNRILRLNLNFSFYNGIKRSNIHVDHPFPHKQILVYLHVDDLKSYTCIKINKKFKKIKPTPNKAVVFDSYDHYQITPTKGMRIVLVGTFI